MYWYTLHHIPLHLRQHRFVSQIKVQLSWPLNNVLLRMWLRAWNFPSCFAAASARPCPDWCTWELFFFFFRGRTMLVCLGMSFQILDNRTDILSSLMVNHNITKYPWRQRFDIATEAPRMLEWGESWACQGFSSWDWLGRTTKWRWWG